MPGNKFKDLFTKKNLAQNLGLEEVIDFGNYDLRGSFGQQTAWANVPWMACFDKDITTTAHQGYYITYLYAADMSCVYITLNQGWTYFQERYRGKEGLRNIKLISNVWKERLKEHAKGFVLDSIDLKCKKPLTIHRGYEAGCICGKVYYKDSLPEDEVLKDDLIRMIGIYKILKDFMIDNDVEKTNDYILRDCSAKNKNVKIVRKKDEEDIAEIIKNEGRGTVLSLKQETPFFVKPKKSYSDVTKGKTKDYLTVNKKLMDLGDCGEYMVLNREQQRLASLGKRPMHVSKTEGDHVGYDIKSYNDLGEEIYIEVKTTKGDINTPFFISENEVRYSKRHNKKYYLYRIYNFSHKDGGKGDLYIVPGRIDKAMHLTAERYVVCGKKRPSQNMSKMAKGATQNLKGG